MLLSAAEVFLQIVIFCYYGSYGSVTSSVSQGEGVCLLCGSCGGGAMLGACNWTAEMTETTKKEGCIMSSLWPQILHGILLSCYPACALEDVRHDCTEGNVKDRILDDDLSGIFRMCPVFLSIFPAICNQKWHLSPGVYYTPHRCQGKAKDLRGPQQTEPWSPRRGGRWPSVWSKSIPKDM